MVRIIFEITAFECYDRQNSSDFGDGVDRILRHRSNEKWCRLDIRSTLVGSGRIRAGAGLWGDLEDLVGCLCSSRGEPLGRCG